MEEKHVPLPKPPKLSDIKFELSNNKKRYVRDAKRFIITSATNNTPVDKTAWALLHSYALEIEAEILIVPVRYKNPTSKQEEHKADLGAWWPRCLMPYLTDELVKLHEHLYLMAHVRVQATATNPLTGLETLSAGESSLFGHPQLSLKMVPTPQNRLPKMMHTTGSISVPDYSASKAGVRGDHHHTLGGLVVELDGPRFHVRSLLIDDEGGFYDLGVYRNLEGVQEGETLALVTGDEHAAFNDDICREATYGDGGITDTLKPAAIVRHDVFDGYSVNHHTAKDPLVQAVKAEAGVSVSKELEACAAFINETTPPGTVNFIVQSNHHQHLMRWLKETSPLDSPVDAKTWHSLWGRVMNTTKMTPSGAKCGDPFELWMVDHLDVPTTFGAPKSIAGIDVSHHGHAGSNGSRGSIRQFSKLGVDTIIGHSHTPGIQQRAYQVGTSSRLRLEYTGEISSWAHCHCAIYGNGKRQLIFIIDGAWRA